MSGGGVGNTTNTSNVGGLGSVMGQPRPQVIPQVTPQVQRPAPQAVPPATNIAAINDFANQQRALGGGPAGNLVTLPPATNIAAINDFANQQRALGVGGVGGLGGVGQVPFQGGMPPQLRTQLQTLLNTPGQVGQLGGMPLQGQNPQVADLIRQGNMQSAMDLQNKLAMQNGKDIVPRPLGVMPFQGGMGIGGIGQVPFQAPNGNFGVPGGMGLGGVGQVQQALGGPPIQMDLSQDAYRRFLAQAQFAGQPPTYDQWVQQRSAQRPIPQVFPQKPGVPGFGLSTAMQPYFQELAQQAVQQPLVSLPRPQVFPQKPGLSTTMQPRPQLGGMGLAGLANMLRGRQ